MTTGNDLIRDDDLQRLLELTAGSHELPRDGVAAVLAARDALERPAPGRMRLLRRRPIGERIERTERRTRPRWRRSRWR